MQVPAKSRWCVGGCVGGLHGSSILISPPRAAAGFAVLSLEVARQRSFCSPWHRLALEAAEIPEHKFPKEGRVQVREIAWLSLCAGPLMSPSVRIVSMALIEQLTLSICSTLSEQM